MVLFLIGFMGCGKSTIGRRVAARIGYSFIDMDAEIERRTGMDIPEIFAAEGEEGFRRRERQFLEEVMPEDDVIIATGGGAPCFGDNLELMKSRGSVIYFNMRPGMLFRRLDKGRHRRPKLAGMDDLQLMKYIEATLAEREQYYSGASMTIDCNGASDEQIASYIEYFITGHAGN